uniref:Uncharacterized protein n=1 Tax=Cyprinus carpio TaxID=7962 RepID=A0A8C1RYE5_CYPCA
FVTFDMKQRTPSQYEAHSDAQVLVLLDVSPDQSMLDEGVAREVINRMTCSKPGHLVPSDEITVYFQPAEEYLDKVIQAHTDFIFATTKAPLKPYPVAHNASVIVQEKTQSECVWRSAACSSADDLIPTFFLILNPYLVGRVVHIIQPLYSINFTQKITILTFWVRYP